jgi:predicted ATPase
VLLIDTANVLGSRPTGWWRDRAAATARLVDQVRAAAAAGRLASPVVMVVEGQARPGAAEGVGDGVEIVHAPRDGDAAIVELTASSSTTVTVVTADRALAERVRAAGADVVGPGWLLTRLDLGGGAVSP